MGLDLGSLVKSPPVAVRLREYDQKVRTEGYVLIAGADEAGRGPWAGPVVAAAVIMPKDHFLPDVNDSKKLSSSRREKLFPHIIESCTDYAVGIVDHDVIDRINILQATCRALREAVSGLSTDAHMTLIDGNLPVSGIRGAYRCCIRGDSLSYCIACASIIAKVTRDRIMCELDKQYPGWAFGRHKGYGTPEHAKLLRIKGLSPIHRKSFSPMKEMADHVTLP